MMQTRTHSFSTSIASLNQSAHTTWCFLDFLEGVSGSTSAAELSSRLRLLALARLDGDTIIDVVSISGSGNWDVAIFDFLSCIGMYYILVAIECFQLHVELKYSEFRMTDVGPALRNMYGTIGQKRDVNRIRKPWTLASTRLIAISPRLTHLTSVLKVAHKIVSVQSQSLYNISCHSWTSWCRLISHWVFSSPKFFCSSQWICICTDLYYVITAAMIKSRP